MNTFSLSEKMTRGKIPINIATSLSLESLFNIHDELKHDKLPIKDYNEYWLNLNTLYRNLVGSYSNEMKNYLDEVSISELMDDDFKQLNIAFKPYKTTVVLYQSNYDKQLNPKNRLNQYVKWRKPNTPKQMQDWQLMNKTINYFNNKFDYVNSFDDEIKPNSKSSKCIIQTHQVVDLLSFKNFESMDLVESHTGKIKSRYNWHTKFINGKDLFMIPFTQYFLRIFGEKEFFQPMDKKIRLPIVDLAKKSNWTATTTYDKIRHDINKLEDSTIKSIIRSMM